MKKVYLLLLSLVVLMIALTGCGKDTDSAKDNSKPITLRYSTMQNKDHISYQVALNIKQAVEEKTEGRVYIETINGKYNAAWSSHSYYEFMLDFSGEFCVSLGETTYSLTKGDVLVIKPNQPHRVEPKGPEEFKLISIVMSEKFSDYLQYRDINWNPLVLFEKNLLMPVLHFHGKHLERLEQMMYMLVAESENKQNFQDVFIADISELIVLEIGRYCGSIYPEIVRNAVYNDVFKDIPYMLKNILEYINSNYQNSSLTLSSIAERFWVNPSYLSRYFKTYMGINIVQYIRSMRIFYAKSLLQSSDMSIAEVAEKVGVKSASHFSKIFENEVGESPSKFRKSYFDRNHS